MDMFLLATLHAPATPCCRLAPVLLPASLPRPPTPHTSPTSTILPQEHADCPTAAAMRALGLFVFRSTYQRRQGRRNDGDKSAGNSFLASQTLWLAPIST